MTGEKLNTKERGLQKREQAMPDGLEGSIVLTKLDVARVQIETALDLWFNGGDAVSAHTLAGAAHRVVHDIAKLTGDGAALTDWKRLESWGWNPKAFTKAVREAETFFKHADNDPHDTYRFPIRNTAFVLWSAIECYRRLASERSEIMTIFLFWMGLHLPNTLPKSTRNYLESIITDEAVNWSRMEFLKRCRESRAQTKV